MRIYDNQTFVVVNSHIAVSYWTSMEEAYEAASELKKKLSQYPYENQQVEVINLVDWHKRIKVLVKAGKV